MISNASKIRAARALLDWGQKELSERAGVSQLAITNLETGKTEPQRTTLEKIFNVFELAGIEFSDRGVEVRQDTITIIEGENWFPRLLDDVYFSLLDKPGAEMLIECGDERQSSRETVNYTKKIRNAGIRIRALVEEGNTHLTGALSDYRYIPKEYFTNDVSIIYGDKFAVCAAGNSKAVVFKESTLSQSRRNIFNLLWSSLDKPRESTANERY